MEKNNKKLGREYIKLGILSLAGLVILTLVLPSVSAMTVNLNIAASGWPPCPASTGTSYTVNVHVTGTSSSSFTYLVIGIWDHVSGRWVAHTVTGPHGTNIDVRRSLTIRTPNDSGYVRYGAFVFYWDWNQRRWVYATHVNMRTTTVGTPVADVQDFVISPSSVRHGDSVTLSWSVRGDSNALFIITNVYHLQYKDGSWRWVYIGTGGGGFQYVTSPDGAPYSRSFSLTHQPTHPGINYYYVEALYWDWCSRSWRGWNYEMSTVVVCRGPAGNWFYCHSSDVCKCSAHEGHCDNDNECVPGTRCYHGAGSFYEHNNWDRRIGVCDYDASIMPTPCNCECRGGLLWGCKNWDYRVGPYSFSVVAGAQGSCGTREECVNCNNYYLMYVRDEATGNRTLEENGYNLSAYGGYGRPIDRCYRYHGFAREVFEDNSGMRHRNVLHTEGPECDPDTALSCGGPIFFGQCVIYHEGVPGLGDGC